MLKNSVFHLIVLAGLALLLPACRLLPRQTVASDCTADESQVTAFMYVNLVPMTTERAFENQTVVVEGTRIVEVGSADEVTVPDCASVVDGAGAYLMPGLADMHVHIMEDSRTEWPVSPLSLYLAYGVTTIRNLDTMANRSGDESFVLRWREEIGAGELPGPTIYTTKLALNGPLDDPRGAVKEIFEGGFDFIKPYALLTPNELHEIMTAAKQYDLYAVGHIPQFVGVEQVLREGMEEIAHVEELSYEFIAFDRTPTYRMDEWVSRVATAVRKQYSVDQGFDAAEFRRLNDDRLREILRQLEEQGVVVCTTLSLGEVIEQKVFDPPAYLRREGVEYLPANFKEQVRQGRDKHQLVFRGIEDLAPWKRGVDLFIFEALRQAGIPLVLGSDAGGAGIKSVPGLSVHEELHFLTEHNLTPYEALRTATVHAAQVAEAMTGEGNFGTVEVGKRADLILVEGNPLEDVDNVRQIRGVMAAGRWYSAATLAQLIALEQ